MTTTPHDPNSDQALLARHRDYFRTVHPDIAAAARKEFEAKNLIAIQLPEAIRHLHAILNENRTATESWQAEQEARQWLKSIGSEPN